MAGNQSLGQASGSSNIDKVRMHHTKDNIYLFSQRRTAKFNSMKYNKYLDVAFWTIFIDPEKMVEVFQKANKGLEENLFDERIRDINTNPKVEQGCRVLRVFFLMQNEGVDIARSVGFNIRNVLKLEYQSCCQTDLMYCYKQNFKVCSMSYMCEDECRFCPGAPKTFRHILNGCNMFLQDGRYTWRHDAVLNFLRLLIDSGKYTVFADLPGQRTEDDGTVPKRFLPNRSDLWKLRPDLVIMKKNKGKQSKDLFILELTVPFEDNIKEAHINKMEKYIGLSDALQSQGFKVDMVALEIGSLGHITRRNKEILEALLMFARKAYSSTTRLTGLELVNSSLSRLASMASWHIYSTRNQDIWVEPSEPPPLMFYSFLDLVPKIPFEEDEY
jgi:hypothetical protein